MSDQPSLWTEVEKPGPPTHPVQRHAVLSADRVYRYELERWWGDPMTRTPSLAFIMLNPSTADAELDDPTIRRCVGFARSLGYDGIRVANLFAYRTPSPQVLRDAEKAGVDVVGPDNDRYLSAVFRAGRINTSHVIAAWGAVRPIDDVRVSQVMDLARATDCPLTCLGKTKAGHPRHPLYLPGDSLPIRWGDTMNDHPRDCPECVQGKHRNCTEVTIDPDTDDMVPCECAEGGHA